MTESPSGQVEKEGAMRAPVSPAAFALSTGGLIDSLSLRLHIRNPGSYNIRRRIIVLFALTWLPILLLSAVEGNLINGQLAVPFLSDPTPYVRYFVTLPLLVIASTIIDPLIATAISSIASSGIVPPSKQAEFSRAFQALDRRNDSYLADIVILAIVALLAVTVVLVSAQSEDIRNISTWAVATVGDHFRVTNAGWWFYLVASPVLLVVLFRWLWRFLIWCEFMFRVSRIELDLEPSHPDLAGGLGVLRNGQNAFLIMFLAVGTLLSVSLAYEMLYGDAVIAMVGPVVIVFVAVCMVIMTVPLLFYTPQLIQTKLHGRAKYGALGYRLSRAFDEKWAVRADRETGQSLLETADASTVCDYSTVYQAVASMRYVAGSSREYVLQAIVLLIPFAPLVLIVVPFPELLKMLSGTLF